MAHGVERKERDSVNLRNGGRQRKKGTSKTNDKGQGSGRKRQGAGPSCVKLCAAD